MAIQIQIRRDTTANWASNNPVLAQGEIGLNLDLNLIKIGDGVTYWTSLNYFGNDYQTISFDETTAYLTISNGNTVSLSALSGGGTLTNETDPIFNTWAQANSGNYDLAYHTILTGGDIGGDINLTGSLSADSIKFNIGAGITTPAQGEIAWDSEDETLHYTLDTDTTARIGQDQYMRIKVAETVKKGQALYASGASGGGSGNIQASLYSAVSSGIDELYFIGLAAADMATNDFGFAIAFGKLKGVSLTNTKETADTSDWPIGTVLYVSAKQAGYLTSVPPTAPNKDIPVAFVISESGGTRGIFVRYEHGYHLDEIHDVRYIQPLLDGDLLTWDNTLSAWVNRAETDPIFTTWAQANSASYTSTYTTVNTNSANWDYQGTDIKSLTSVWQDTYTTVNTNSSNWDQTLLFNDITAELTISNGNTVSLSALSGGGGTLTNETDPIFSTWAQANSASYTSTYTTVNTNSASWSAGGSGSGGLSGISYNRWAFTGSPPVSSFSLSGATSDTEEAYRVTVDFLLQDPLSYTVSNETITFTEAPPLSSSIVVIESYATAGDTYQPLDAQLTDLAGLSYTGNALKVVQVNAGETAFELATASGTPIRAIIEETTTTRTLALTDSHDFIHATNASGCAITVPPQTDVTWADGTIIYGDQGAAGAVTIVAGAGVTIDCADTLVTDGQHSAWALIRKASDVWLLTGRLVA
jgi:hypothetical protein